MRLLVADFDGTHAEALVAQLQALDGEFDVRRLNQGENLLAAVRRLHPDVVIVDMARPDRDGLDSVRALNSGAMLPILMFIDEDDPGFMEEAIAAGVSSYHVIGVDLPVIKPVLRTAVAVFGRMRELQSRLTEAEEQISARRLIEAAKKILMTEQNMSEPAAHKFLQRSAMRQQKKISEIAAALLVAHKGDPP